MTYHDHFSHPGHWDQRAESTRAMARHTTAPEDRQRLLKVARGYDRLAMRAEDWKPAEVEKHQS